MAKFRIFFRILFLGLSFPILLEAVKIYKEPSEILCRKRIPQRKVKYQDFLNKAMQKKGMIFGKKSVIQN